MAPSTPIPLPIDELSTKPSISASTREITPLNSVNIQYSVRRARPEKSAYWRSTFKYHCMMISPPDDVSATARWPADRDRDTALIDGENDSVSSPRAHRSRRRVERVRRTPPVGHLSTVASGHMSTHDVLGRVGLPMPIAELA